MKLILSGFLGANRAIKPRLLADAVGVESLNQKPGRGDLQPWRVPMAVATVPAGRKTIYRMGRDVASDSQYWLSWPTIVHAMRGFITGDTTERTFYTGDGKPKQTDNTIGLAGAGPYPTAWRYLGVPAPIAQCLVSPNNTGVSTTMEYRYYTYTYVTDKGEESAPAPVSAVVNCKTDDTLAITNLEPPPSGAYGITRIRIYRTQTGQAGDTEFFFLSEQLSTVSTATDDNRTLGEVLPTDGWLPPPDDLHFLTPMWNGMAGGITNDGAVRFSVAFKPYAWPIVYEILPPDAKAVALGRFGQSLLVLTTGKPLLVAGSSPDSLDQMPLEFESCIAPQSVASFSHGVVWACPDGLAYYGSNGAKLLTQGLMTRDDWQAIDPETIVAGAYEGAYLCFYTQGGVRKGFMIDPVQPEGIYFLAAGYEALYFDDLQDALYVLDGTAVKKWDAGADMMTATFKSKLWRAPPWNCSAGRVVADAYPVTVAVEAGPLEAEQVAALVARHPTFLSAPNPTSIRFTKVVANRQPFRLPDGFLARDWQVEVSCTGSVEQVVIASSMRELGEA